MNPSDTIVSYIRTGAAILAGVIISWLVSLGLEVGETANTGLTMALTGVAIAVYYMIARALEKRWPIVGRWLLGSSRQPEYTPPQAGPQ